MAVVCHVMSCFLIALCVNEGLSAESDSLLPVQPLYAVAQTVADVSWESRLIDLTQLVLDQVQPQQLLPLCHLQPDSSTQSQHSSLKATHYSSSPFCLFVLFVVFMVFALDCLIFDIISLMWKLFFKKKRQNHAASLHLLVTMGTIACSAPCGWLPGRSCSDDTAPCVVFFFFEAAGLRGP